MDLLAALAVMVVIFVGLELLWCRPSGSGSRGAAPGQPLDDDPFALPFVRQRLAALTEELRRLEQDRGIYALAFRTCVARTAYEALLADAARLAATTTIELEITTPSTP